MLVTQNLKPEPITQTFSSFGKDAYEKQKQTNSPVLQVGCDLINSLLGQAGSGFRPEGADAVPQPAHGALLGIFLCAELRKR